MESGLLIIIAVWAVGMMFLSLRYSDNAFESTLDRRVMMDQEARDRELVMWDGISDIFKLAARNSRSGRPMNYGLDELMAKDVEPVYYLG